MSVNVARQRATEARWPLGHCAQACCGRLHARAAGEAGVGSSRSVRRIVEGSRDAHERRIAERDGLEAAAREEYSTLKRLPGPRSGGGWPGRPRENWPAWRRRAATTAHPSSHSSE